MPNVWIATKCYKVQRNLVALFTKCDEMTTTECFEMI